LTRVSDSTSITLTDPLNNGNLVATLPATLPGISINSSGLTAGDSYLIRPTFTASTTITHNIIDSRKVALATNKATDSNGIEYDVTGPMPGDNRNGLLLAGLENKKGMLGETASFQGGYGLVVSKVGVLTNSAKIATAAQETLLNSAKNSWGNISGVNLDEEAANLIKFQQSYQAAAQMISVSDALFDSLLGAVS